MVKFLFSRQEAVAAFALGIAPFLVMLLPTALYRALVFSWGVKEPLSADAGAGVMFPVIAFGLFWFFGVFGGCVVLCDRAGFFDGLRSESKPHPQ